MAWASCGAHHGSSFDVDEVAPYGVSSIEWADRLHPPLHGMFLNQTDIDLVRDGMRALELEILTRGAQAAAVDAESIARAVFKAFLDHRKALPAPRSRKVEALALISMLNIHLFEALHETGSTTA